MLSWHLRDVDVEKVRLGVNTLSLDCKECFKLADQSPASGQSAYHTPNYIESMEREGLLYAWVLPGQTASEDTLILDGADWCNAIHEAAGAARPVIAQYRCPPHGHARTMLV